MTWVKTNFCWMMFRCGEWCFAAVRERVRVRVREREREERRDEMRA
jgi:hypothetical protein